jgi:hypothetical protein
VIVVPGMGGGGSGAASSVGNLTASERGVESGLAVASWMLFAYDN